MKTKITLHFYAKSTKANANGLLPIYVRLTVDGKRLEFSTKKFVEKSKWSSELAKMKGTTEEARSINSYLDLMKSKVLDAQMELLHRNETLSIENFKNKAYKKGLVEGILRAGERLKTYFPFHHDDTNELSNEISKS